MEGRRSFSTPMKLQRDQVVLLMNQPKKPLPTFGEGTTAGPMVTFMRSDSLRSFKTKRNELKGNVDMRALLAKQRRAIL